MSNRAFVHKTIDHSATTIEEGIVHYKHNLVTGSSGGLNSIKYVSGSAVADQNDYWKSLHVLFYTSGSPILREYRGNLDLYDSPSHNFRLYNPNNPQHVNKFHGYGNGHIVSIPQQYFGEEIKRESFILTDTQYSDNSGNNLIIKDDGYGNLYSTNAHHSQSVATSPSSSDNYVGNIFYNQGLVVLTETGSWSGSVNYSDLASGNFEVEFKGTERITTHEYSVVIKPNEFNDSMNYSLRCFPENSSLSMPEDSGSILSNQFLCSEFTSSDFQPYITSVALYNRGEYHEPVIVADLPKPLRVSDKITMILKLRLDM